MPVTKLGIKSRQPFAGGESFGDVGPYEQLDGVVHFSVDPDNAANETITDLELAPRDERGLVSFSSDFQMLQPLDPGRGNRRILLDILNRGRALALRNINSAPEVAPGAPLDPGRLFDAAGLHCRLVRLAARCPRRARSAADKRARCHEPG